MKGHPVGIDEFVLYVEQTAVEDLKDEWRVSIGCVRVSIACVRGVCEGEYWVCEGDCWCV